MPAKRMSKIEVLFRETVCPATLADDVDDETVDTLNGDLFLIDGVASLRRLSLRSSITRRGSSRLEEREPTPPPPQRRESTPPPPPPPLLDTPEVHEALAAAARRRASSLKADDGQPAAAVVGANGENV